MTATDVTRKMPRELVNAIMDSTRWNGFKFREGDIVIGTWAKSGTTWTQQIVSQLIFDGAEGIAAADVAPWVDMRILPFDEMMLQLEGQTHRRFLKTHLPADALVLSPKAKYLYIGRDGRDVYWSWYNHLVRMLPALYEAFNNPPGLPCQPLVRPDGDIRKAFRGWLAGEGYSADTFWPHVRSWWDMRDAPNVLLVHFSNLKADMAGEIRRIARFLEIEIDEAIWPAILEHCSFDYMKKNADSLSELGKSFFDGGLSNFIYKGTNGRWRDVLSREEKEEYERTAKENLAPECAHWLETGELAPWQIRPKRTTE
jgi:aryl sulfotransferase